MGAALALASLAACGPTTPRTGGDASPDASARDAGGGRDAGPVRPADVRGDGVRYDYLIRVAAIADEEPDRRAAGFDLDGFETSSTGDEVGCGYRDFTAPDRYGGARGVDNQGPAVLEVIRGLNDGVDLNTDLRQAIRDGSAVLLLRLEEVGDFVDDGRVVLSFLTGSACEPLRYEGADSLLSPGQTFAADADALVDGQPASVFGEAWIEDGLLHARDGNFSLRIPGSDPGELFVIELNGVRLRAEVSADALAQGVLGGHVETENVVAIIDSLGIDPPPDPDLVMQIAQGYADLDLDGAPAECEALTLAVTVEAVDAVIAPPKS